LLATEPQASQRPYLCLVRRAGHTGLVPAGPSGDRPAGAWV